MCLLTPFTTTHPGHAAAANAAAAATATADMCSLYFDYWKNNATYNYEVPDDQGRAVCRNATSCDLNDNFNGAKGDLSSDYTNFYNDEFEKTTSVLFNAFIMMQVGEGRGGGGGGGAGRGRG